jgi:hypothetical protein
LSFARIKICQFLTLFRIYIYLCKREVNMNHFSIASNLWLFTTLLALTPAIFAGMWIGSESVAAAIAASVAYVSLVVGERLETA